MDKGMNVNTLLSEIQKLKDNGQISGETKVLTYDIWQNEMFVVESVRITEENNLLLS